MNDDSQEQPSVVDHVQDEEHVHGLGDDDDDDMEFELGKDEDEVPLEGAYYWDGGDDDDDLALYSNLELPPWPSDPDLLEAELQLDPDSDTPDPWADVSLTSSSAPSFVKVFGYCDCPSCVVIRSSTSKYPPDERARKLALYKAWQERCRVKMEARTQERRKREKDLLALARERAVDVVAMGLGLTEEEVKMWKRETEAWWDRRFERDVRGYY